MRIDVLLVRLRFVKSRSLAKALVAQGHIRRNGRRVTGCSDPIAAGDVLTLPLGNHVRVLAIDALPPRRGPAAEAAACYRDLTLAQGSP